MLDDLRAMTLFVRTVELGSFRAAAKASNLSPSVVSHHIQQLEKKYGVALLYRSTRKLAQTDEGRRFYERARQMVAAAAGAVDVLTGEAASPYGKLTVSLPAAQVRGAITRKVAEFAELHPYVHLKLVCTDEPVDLFAGGVDVALRAGTLKDSSLKSKRVGSVGRTLVCSPRYLARKAVPDHPDDLAGWDWIRLTHLPASRRFTHADGRTADVDYEARIEADSVEAMYQMARHGLGLATPPDFLVADDIAAGRLIELLPDWHLPAMPVTAVWPPNVPAESLTLRFVHFLTGGEGVGGHSPST